MDLNSVNLIGRLGGTPELRYTASGKAVSSFDLAVSGLKNKDNKMADTYWIPCVAWGRTAEILNEYCGKGKQLGVGGRLQTRTYETKEGQKRKAVEVVVENLQLLGGKGEGGGSGAAGSGAGASATASGWGADSGEVSVDEIPF